MKLGARLVAVVALLAYIVLAGIAALLLLRNPVLALLAVPTAGLLAYAAWLLFSGSDRRRRRGRWLLVAGLLLAAAELLIFIGDPANRRAVLQLAVLSILYAVCIGILRAYYWRRRRQKGRPDNPISFRKPVLIINPKSGGGRAIKSGIESLAQQQGIEVVVLQPGDTMEAIAAQAVQRGADIIGVSGGDGSIGAVAKVALQYNLPLVILPGGTRCHFARDIGLHLKRISDALAGFHGVERRVDVGSINGRIFVNNVSFGLYADIVSYPEYRHNKLRAIRQVLQSMADGTKELYDLRFRHGHQHVSRAAQVLVAVNRYETLRLLELGRRQQLDAGTLQVTAITEINDSLVKALITSVSLNRLRTQGPPAGFWQWETKAFTMSSNSDSLVVGVDGEREAYNCPIKLKIMPGVLRLYVPAEGERSRPLPRFSTKIVKLLWQQGLR